MVLSALDPIRWSRRLISRRLFTLSRCGNSVTPLRLYARFAVVYEFMNALNYNPKISSNEIVAKVRDLLDLELELVPPSGEYGSQIGRIARKYSISIYDASYVALTNLMVTRLVTADKKLREKLPASANVLLIEDLSRRWSLP